MSFEPMIEQQHPRWYDHVIDFRPSALGSRVCDQAFAGQVGNSLSLTSEKAIIEQLERSQGAVA